MNYPIENYQKLLYKECHRVSAKWHVDFDDMLSCAYEIYVWTLNNYDGESAKFSTYLTTQLKGRLVDEAKKIKRVIPSLYSDMDREDDDLYFEDTIKARDEVGSDVSAILNSAKDVLSYEAYQMLKWYLTFPSEVDCNNDSDYSFSCRKKLGISKVASEMGVEEIKNFWRNYQMKDNSWVFEDESKTSDEFNFGLLAS